MNHMDMNHQPIHKQTNVSMARLIGKTDLFAWQNILLEEKKLYSSLNITSVVKITFRLECLSEFAFLSTPAHKTQRSQNALGPKLVYCTSAPSNQSLRIHRLLLCHS